MSVSGDALFLGGPPEKVERLVGLIRPGSASIGNRIFFFILIGWVPLLDLALVQSAFGEPGAFSFARDFAVHARMLIAVPLLVLAERACAPRLSRVVNKLVENGVIREADFERYKRIRLSTIALRDSPLAEFAVVALAYVVVFAIALTSPLGARPAWTVSQIDPLLHLSLAGWWHCLISVPLLLLLLFSWLWRVVLWARFLAQVAHLDLRLNAAHPDGAGGLAFIGYSVQAFWIVALALGVIVAGTAANQVVYHGATFSKILPLLFGVGAVSLLVFCGPLTALSWKMVLTWRHAIHAYSALARDVGEHFEAKWLGADIGPDALDVNDFSATTDLYSITANVYRMRLIPIALTTVIVLEAATLAPFVPVALLSMPLTEVLNKIAGFLM